MLHTCENAVRGLHKRVRKQLVADEDNRGLRRSASQRSHDQAVGGRQQTGQELQGRTPRRSRRMSANRTGASSKTTPELTLSHFIG